MNSFVIVTAFVVMAFVSSFASYFLKMSSSGKHSGKLGMLLSPFFYLGGVLYVIAAGINIFLLQYLPMAIVMPLGATTYIVTMFLSVKLLNEKITGRKILGMFIIILGVAMVASGRV